MLAVASLVFSIFSLCFNYYYYCQKRYEETFFNMLEQKRKIVEGLKMRSKVWDESDSIYRDYNANDSFIMICSEVNNIYMSLFNHGKYEKQATQNSPNEATEETPFLRRSYLTWPRAFRPDGPVRGRSNVRARSPPDRNPPG